MFKPEIHYKFLQPWLSTFIWSPLWSDMTIDKDNAGHTHTKGTISIFPIFLASDKKAWVGIFLSNQS